jgi:hypothetical protein
MSSSVKEELASPNPNKKKLLEDVSRGEGCFKTLDNYSQVQDQDRKELYLQKMFKREQLKLFI